MIFPVLITHSVEYSITENGKTNEGVSVDYLMCGEPENTPSAKGISSVKGSLPLAQRLELRAVPGYYNMEFTMSSSKNAQGRVSPSLKPKGIVFIEPVRLEPAGKASAPSSVGVVVSTSPANSGGRVAA